MRSILNTSARTLSTLLVGLCSITVNSSTGNAVSVLDQSFAVTRSQFQIDVEHQTPGPGLQADGVAQTFAVGITGELTRLDLYFATGSFAYPHAGTFAVNLLSGAPGAAGTNVLATQNFNMTSATGTLQFDFSSFDVMVTAGQLLSWSVIGAPSPPAPNKAYALIYGSSACTGFCFPPLPPTYAGGTSFSTFNNGTSWSQSTSTDFAFQTWVDNSPPTPTPIPGALPLFVGGLGMMGLLKLRKTRKANCPKVA